MRPPISRLQAVVEVMFQALLVGFSIGFVVWFIWVGLTAGHEGMAP